MRILLVEDDRELAEYVCKGLEEEGYVVQVRFDGAAGLKAAEMTGFDIKGLDVRATTLHGLAVSKRLPFPGRKTLKSRTSTVRIARQPVLAASQTMAASVKSGSNPA